MSISLLDGIEEQLFNLATLLCNKASITPPTTAQKSIAKSLYFITQALTIILAL